MFFWWRSKSVICLFLWGKLWSVNSLLLVWPLRFPPFSAAVQPLAEGGRRKKKKLELLFSIDAVNERKSKQITNLALEVKICLCCNIHLHFLSLKTHLKCITWDLNPGRNTNMTHDQSKQKSQSECVRLKFKLSLLLTLGCCHHCGRLSSSETE